MTSRTDRLYLIGVKYRTVAIIPAIDAFNATRKYLARAGFGDDYRYFCSYLMTTTTTFDAKLNNINKYCFITADTKTIGGDILSISSQLVVSCDDIFSLVDLRDINSPLFIRPTIKEVRNCNGFGNASVYELRKFCI